MRRKRETSLNQKGVQSCYICVCLEGNHWSVFLAAGLGHSGKPQWTACIRDLGGKKQEKKLRSRSKTLSESVKENRDWNWTGV